MLVDQRMPWLCRPCFFEIKPLSQPGLTSRRKVKCCKCGALDSCVLCDGKKVGTEGNITPTEGKMICTERDTASIDADIGPNDAQAQENDDEFPSDESTQMDLF